MVSWIRSLGGPLIAVPEDDLAAWRGGEEIDSQGNELEEDETDYWRVCEIVEQVGLVRVAGRDSLVLNNGPLRTAYLPEEYLFVQQVAKTSRADILDVVVAVLGEISWRDMFYWERGGGYVLFDAAGAGDDVEGDNVIRFTLPSGRSRVRIANIEPTPELDVWVTLTQLVP